MDRSRFLGNQGLRGGAIAGSALERLSNSVLSGNTAEADGGALVEVTGTIVNCAIVLNEAGSVAGGVHALDLLTIDNTILWANTDGSGAGEGAQATLGLPVVRSSLVQGLSLYAGAGNFDGDPLLVDPWGPDGVAGTGDERFGLGTGSPCLEAGDTSLAEAAGLGADLRGLPRFEDWDGDGEARVDVGAVEAQDCDGSGTPDAEDLFLGLAEDCDGNGTPDACDVEEPGRDCDRDGLLDECEIAADPSLDCDGNGRIDTCDVANPVTRITSPALAPLFFGSPQRWAATGLPTAVVGDVTVTVIARTDLGASFETVRVLIDGEDFGSLFAFEAQDCVEVSESVSLERSVYEALAADGELVFDLSASADVDSFCSASDVVVELLIPTGADCDGNGRLDACDIADGAVEDCNGNGRPDACDAAGFVYAIDDGSSEDRFGILGGGDLAWMTQFDVEVGSEVIGAIDLAWDDTVLANTPTTLALLDDPNNDKDPRDGVVLWTEVVPSRSDVSRGDTLFRIPIEPTFVGNAGESFFVVALVSHDDGVTPAIFDTDPPLISRTWAAAGFVRGQLDIFALSQTADFFDKNVGFGSPGHYLQRAVSVDEAVDCDANGVPDECQPDCNSNGIADACDIRDGISEDANGNGVPDECECAGDLDGNGRTDVLDFARLANAFGATGLPPFTGGDLDGDGDVDALDFAALAEDFGCVK